MNVAAVYLELFGRIPSLVHPAVDGLDAASLTRQPVPGRTRSVGWCGTSPACRITTCPRSSLDDQLWIADGWTDQFGRAAAPNDVGFGYTAAQVAAFDPMSAALLAHTSTRSTPARATSSAGSPKATSTASSTGAGPAGHVACDS